VVMSERKQSRQSQQSQQSQKDPMEDADEHTPESAFERTVEEGRRRLGRGASSLFATGLVGGIDVAIGVLALLIVKHATHSEVLSGLAFTIGFVCLTLARSELFTENFLVPVVAVVARQAPAWRLGRLWVSAFVFNLAGGFLLTWFFMAGFPDLRATAITAGSKYVDFGIGWRSFALAIIAGLVITLMTWMQHATASLGGKVVAAVMAAFLLGAGTLDHAIVASLVMFSALHAGRAPFGYLSWFTTAIWAAFGNMVGGIGLVTVLRMLQVPERVARRRAEPAPEVAASSRRKGRAA
jgi:formate/nitrite transporter FocA (FNT family)